MRNLEEYIKENKQYHLRNLIIDIDEELRNIKNTEHSKERENDQTHNSSENIKIEEIKELVNKCDELIVNKLLNNKIKINNKEEQFGIIKLSNKNYKSFAVIFEVIYFNNENFEYDLKVITANKYKDKIFKFKDNTKFIFEIDKSNYVKEIEK